MFKKIKTWWKNRKQPKVWAVKMFARPWVKAVTYKKPKPPMSRDDVVGPFRSEVDCEEFCDHANKYMPQSLHKQYTREKNGHYRHTSD